MKTYQCHKRVMAAQITDVRSPEEDGSVDIEIDGFWMLLPPKMVARHIPVAGDYLVEYEDGYRSISPKTAFEDGYREVVVENGVNFAKRFDFGLALCALKRGKRVARAGWNGKGMWLSLSCDGSREIAAENFWSPHNAEFARQNGGKATVLPSITMKTATGEILMGWLASQTDMLAEDWMVVG